MAIRTVSFNDGTYFTNTVGAPVENNTQNDSNRFAHNTVFTNLPISNENNAFLIQKPPENTVKHDENNFFLKQSDYRINPFECRSTSAPPPKPFVLSPRPEFGMKTENQIDKTKDKNPFMRAVVDSKKWRKTNS